jgi:REP element-mobilizing transposase RayT
MQQKVIRNRTYSQIYIHIVFAIKYRKRTISPIWEDELHKVITGIIQQKGHKLMAINGMPDHIHILIGMKPICNLSELVREIKKSSIYWIRRNGKTTTEFAWQEGFGAFSVDRSTLPIVINYINNQKEHHNSHTYKDEFRAQLERYDVNYEEKHFFRFADE